MVQSLPEDLLQGKKFVFVTGKGGSGKSIVSLALAYRLAASGRRVKIVELGRRDEGKFSRLPALLECPELGHESRKLPLPGRADLIVEASLLDPLRCLSEYVDLKLPTGGLAGLLLNNRVTGSFLEIVPGLPDLVALGKLWFELTNPKAKGPDIVIFDGPATGHGMTMLKAPANFQKVTKIGPIFRDADAMTHFFQSTAHTALLLTTLPEEMSVQESKEFLAWAKGDFPTPLVVANKCFPFLPAWSTKIASPLANAYDYARERNIREEEALKAIVNLVAQLPFVFPKPKSPPLALQLAQAWGPLP
jgi:anion-transporting  ArsA/GET3 family ATPase